MSQWMFLQGSGSQLGGNLLGDIWQCLDTFMVLTTGAGGITDIQWVKARNATKHPTTHKTENYTQQRIIQLTMSMVSRLRKPALRFKAISKHRRKTNQITLLIPIDVGVHFILAQFWSQGIGNPTIFSFLSIYYTLIFLYCHNTLARLQSTSEKKVTIAYTLSSSLLHR